MSDIKRAMIIGVTKYDSDLENLDFCKNDANGMKEILEKLDYEITKKTYLVGKIGGRDMEDAIHDFFNDKSVKRNDVNLFYFSGHGVPDPNSEDAFLASADIDPDDPDRRGFPFERLTKYMNNCISKRVITVLDCCYSGTASLTQGDNAPKAKGRKAIRKGADRLRVRSGEGKCIIAATPSYQAAYSTLDGGQSVFTRFMIKGLQGASSAVDNNGDITPETLGNYVYDQVTNIYPDQQPERKTDVKGKFVLAHYKTLNKEKNDFEKADIDVDKLKNEAKIFFIGKKFNQAIDVYEKILSVDPRNSSVLNNLGIANYKNQRYQEAINAYELSLKENDQDNDTWRNKGNAYMKLHKFSSALSCFERALSLEPSDLKSLENQGICFQKLGQNKQAKDVKTKLTTMSG